ncbi:MAG: ankyrin repeat domain-containing protein [Verrucomicrobiales bacterium]
MWRGAIPAVRRLPSIGRRLPQRGLHGSHCSIGARRGPKCQRRRLLPLHWAAEGGLSDLVAALLRNGADPNARDRRGFTPLHKAVEGGFSEAAEFLLAKGADSNAQSDTGWTPLHTACASGDEEAACLLLSFKADPKKPDHSGREPSYYAQRAGYKKVGIIAMPPYPPIWLRAILMTLAVVPTILSLAAAYVDVEIPFFIAHIVGYAVAFLAVFAGRFWFFAVILCLFLAFDVAIFSAVRAISNWG